MHRESGDDYEGKEKGHRNLGFELFIARIGGGDASREREQADADRHNEIRVHRALFFILNEILVRRNVSLQQQLRDLKWSEYAVNKARFTVSRGCWEGRGGCLTVSNMISNTLRKMMLLPPVKILFIA